MLARDALSSVLTICPACNGNRVTHLSFAADGVKLISGCKSCGLVFLNPLPMAQEVAARYAPGGSWSRKLEKRKVGREARRALKAAQRDQDAPKSWILAAATSLYENGARDVVDVGCEEGKLLDRLQRRGWNTFGVDLNTKDTIVRHKMLSALPDEPCFDLVIMNHVLEHLPDPLAAMRAARKAIRDGGHLFVGTPTLDGLTTHGKMSYCISEQHVTAYTARSLRHLLAIAGFRCVRRMRAGRPQRMAFIYQASRPSSGLLWPLWPAQREFRRVARRERGLRGWLPFRVTAKQRSNRT